MIIWLGGSVVRNAVIFDIFMPGNILTFKSGYSKEMIDYNIYLFTSGATYTNFAYGLSFLAMVIIAVSERKLIRTQGWLFMSIVLFLIVSPVVFYNIYLDFGLSRAIFYNDVSFLEDMDIQQSIFMRYKNTFNTVFSGIAYLANANIIAYAIWKPLTKQNSITGNIDETN